MLFAANRHNADKERIGIDPVLSDTGLSQAARALELQIAAVVRCSVAARGKNAECLGPSELGLHGLPILADCELLVVSPLSDKLA